MSDILGVVSAMSIVSYFQDLQGNGSFGLSQAKSRRETSAGSPPGGDMSKYGTVKKSFNRLVPIYLLEAEIKSIVISIISSIKPPDKSAYWKAIFFISHPKYGF